MAQRRSPSWGLMRLLRCPPPQPGHPDATRAGYAVGDTVWVGTRRAVILWDGRPEHLYLQVRWQDSDWDDADGEDTDVVAISSVRQRQDEIQRGPARRSPSKASSVSSLASATTTGTFTFGQASSSGSGPALRRISDRGKIMVGCDDKRARGTFVNVSHELSSLSDDSQPSASSIPVRHTATQVLQKRTTVTCEELRHIREQVLRLLHNEWPSLKNSSLLGTWRERDRMMREIGPPMRLLFWKTVARLGRIPRSSEKESISMDKAAAIAQCFNKRFFIEMFSHRWCSSETPDDNVHSKAQVLIEWAKYRWSCGLATFFWVDYTCIDQNDIAPGVCMLPLYVSSCNNIICYDAPGYEPRAWCRIERLMFSAFVAPNNEFVSRNFVFHAEAERSNNELKPLLEDTVVLPDPEFGELSHPEDKIIIQELKALCGEHWGKCWKDGLMEAVEPKLEGVRSLKFGQTRVRLRKFASADSQGVALTVLPSRSTSKTRIVHIPTTGSSGPGSPELQPWVPTAVSVPVVLGSVPEAMRWPSESASLSSEGKGQPCASGHGWPSLSMMLGGCCSGASRSEDHAEEVPRLSSGHGHDQDQRPVEVSDSYARTASPVVPSPLTGALGW